MGGRVLRLAYWFGVALAATTIATLVIAYSTGARPIVFGDDDVARYLADKDPAAGAPPQPASPGHTSEGAGPGGGTSGAAVGVSGGTASAPGTAATPVGGAPLGDPAAPGGQPAPAPTGPVRTSTGPGGNGPPPPTASPPSSSPGLLTSTGGSVVATCTGIDATLLSWSPKPGYSADDPAPGPALQATVKFKSDTASSVLVTVTCSQGMPTLSEQALSDHGGPGKGGGSGGG